MPSRLIIDGNAVYEIDEDCMKKQGDRRKREKLIVHRNHRVNHQGKTDADRN